MTDGLNPGDKVVALAVAAQAAAIVTGAVAGGLNLWLKTHKLSLTGLAVVAGIIIGVVVGRIVGHFIFPATAGNAIVVKWGPSSLPLTLKGNLIASFVVGIVVCLMAILILKVDIQSSVLSSLVTSVIIGVVLAILASLA